VAISGYFEALNCPPSKLDYKNEKINREKGYCVFSNSLIIHQVKTKKITTVPFGCPVLTNIEFDDFTSSTP